ERAWRAALAPLRPELRWLSRTLGAARNWDVFTRDLLPRSSDAEPLRARCELVCRERHSAVTSALRSPRYRRLLANIDDLVCAVDALAPGVAGHKARRLARAVLERRRRKLKRRRIGRLADTPAQARHRIRIAAKKLRYASELLLELYPKKKARR